jgi:hypothetical protein
VLAGARLCSGKQPSDFSIAAKQGQVGRQVEMEDEHTSALVLQPLTPGRGRAGNSASSSIKAPYSPRTVEETGSIRICSGVGMWLHPGGCCSNGFHIDGLAKALHGVWLIFG